MESSPKKKRWRDMKVKKGTRVMNDPNKKPQRRELPPKVEMVLNRINRLEPGLSNEEI